MNPMHLAFEPDSTDPPSSSTFYESSELVEPGLYEVPMKSPNASVPLDAEMYVTMGADDFVGDDDEFYAVPVLPEVLRGPVGAPTAAGRAPAHQMCLDHGDNDVTI
jgi:hypothetical protein